MRSCSVPPVRILGKYSNMTAMRKPTGLTVAEYLAGEGISEVKREFLGGTLHPMAEASNQHNAIALEYHTGLDGAIPLPAIAAGLPLADPYERVEFASIL